MVTPVAAGVAIVTPTAGVVTLLSAVGLLGAEEVYDGGDDSTVFGTAVVPVHRLWSLDLLLQKGVQLLP